MPQTNEPPKSFQKQLTELIVEYSLHETSDAPAFALAVYLESCLEAFNQTVKTKEKWSEIYKGSVDNESGVKED